MVRPWQQWWPDVSRSPPSRPPCLLVPSHGDRLREGRPRPRVGDYSCFQGTQRDRYCSCSRRLLSFARCGLEQRFNVMAQVVDARGRDSRVAPPPTFTSCWQKNPMFINVCWASPPQTEYAVKGRSEEHTS